MKYILAILLTLISTRLFATEFKVDDGQIKFAKVKVVVNGENNYFYAKAKGDNFYDASVLVGTNTVVRTYLDPSSDELNLSTCVLYGFNSAEDWRQCKKGYLNKKIKELKDNDDDLIIVDVDSRINWLKMYRAANR